VSNPQLKLQLSYQSLEPACLTAGFHAHSHLGTLCRQLAIEPLRLLAMLQSSLLKLATLCVKQRNLLKLGVKICSYNDHCSAPFSRALVGLHHQIYSGVGADIVMESITPTTDLLVLLPSAATCSSSPQARNGDFHLVLALLQL